MGEGKEYTCRKCGYKIQVNLGVGFLYPKVYNDTMKSAREGELGPLAKRFLEDNPNGAINPEYVLARCEECGNYEVVPELGMYVPKEGEEPIIKKGNWSTVMPFDDVEYVRDFSDYELKLKYDHKCKCCGGKMKILSENELDTLVCPHCRCQLEETSYIMWD